MWTRADRYHVHGISGAAFTLLGGYVLAAWAKRDLGALSLIDDRGASANAVRDALEAHGGAPEFWGLASLSLALAGVCERAFTRAGDGVPLESSIALSRARRWEGEGRRAPPGWPGRCW